MADDLAGKLLELDEEGSLALVRDYLGRGREPLSLVEELRSGMSEVGARFESGEYYLAELIMSAEIFKQAMVLIEPHMGGESGNTGGEIILGTVKGDIHDIGKNIVASLLRCEGYKVHDLGVDVPPGAFVDKLAETGAGLLALSGLLTPAFDSMKETEEALRESGMRESVRVIVGGGPVNEAVREYVCADAFGGNAAEAVKLAGRYLGGA